MTPLAHEIVKDSLLPVKQRRHSEAANILKLGEGVHFFECSAIWEAALDLGRSMMERGYSETLAFLPAPRTCLEFRPRDGRRVLILLDQCGHSARVLGATTIDDRRIGVHPWAIMPLQGNPSLQGGAVESRPTQVGARLLAAIYGLLAMINTPRVILRRQHMPHRGLERHLVAQRGNVGKWPLHGWSELLLKVRPPEVDDADHEAHLTGARALHFCRAHLRIKLGRLELVSAHWRGDPALGIKQTRYRLAA